MIVNRAALVAKLGLVKSGLASKEMIEQSTSFIFDNGRVFTYNDEVAVSCPCLESGNWGAIPAAEFLGLLSKCKDETLDVEAQDGVLYIRGQKLEVDLRRSSEIVLPLHEIKTPAVWLPLPKLFTEYLQFLSFSLGADMTRPALTCIHCEDAVMESSDGYRITILDLAKDDPCFVDPLLIPGPAAKILSGYPVTHYGAIDGWIHFKTADDLMFSCRTYGDLEYPDLTKHILVSGGELKFPADMVSMLDRASVFSKTKIKSDSAVKVSLVEGKITVSFTGDIGKFEETDRIRYTGVATHFVIRPEFLQAILAHSGVGVVGTTRLLFRGDGFVHVVALCGEK